MKKKKGTTKTMQSGKRKELSSNRSHRSHRPRKGNGDRASMPSPLIEGSQLDQIRKSMQDPPFLGFYILG